MAKYGSYVVLYNPTQKKIKRTRKALAKQCVMVVEKLIEENMGSFFIEKITGELETSFGIPKGSMYIGWKIDLPTLKDDWGEK
jgi:hypothetical protein